MLTLNQIIDQIKTLANAHYQIAEVGVGTIAELQSKPDREYPLLWLSNEGGTLDNNYKVDNIRLTMFGRVTVGDEGQDDDASELEVLSDMQLILLDFLNYFHQNHGQEYVTDKSNTLEHFTERTNDRTAGYSTVLELKQFYDWNKCQIPQSGASIPPTVDGLTLYDFCDADVIARLTADQITCLQAEFGTSIQIQINGVDSEVASSSPYNQEIQNSDGTPIGTAANPSVVPDARIGINGNYLEEIPATVDATLDVHNTSGSDVGSYTGTEWQIADSTVTINGSSLGATGSVLAEGSVDIEVNLDGSPAGSWDGDSWEVTSAPCADATVQLNGVDMTDIPSGSTENIEVRQETSSTLVGSKQGQYWRIDDTTIRNQANDWSDTEGAEGTYTLGLQRVVDSDGSNVDTVDYKPIADGAVFTCTPSASVTLGAFSDSGYSNPVTEADFHDTVYLRAVPSNITPSGFDFFLDNGTDATIIVSGDSDGEYTWTVTELADVWSMKVFADTVSNSLEFTINNDPDVQDFIDATGITDNVIILALNYLVCELKDGGLWDILNAIYPFVGGTATTHKFNLKDARDLDSAFRLDFNGGITHSSTGVKGNGTNGWIDTHLVPSSVSSANDEHISIYSRTDDNGLRVDMGADTPTIKSNIISRYLGDFYARMQGTNTTGDAVADSLGLFVANRINSSEAEGYYNGTQFTKSNAQVGLPNISYHIMALNSNGTAAFFSQREIAFATQGGGISVADELVLRTAIDNFQTRLGRNV